MGLFDTIKNIMGKDNETVPEQTETADSYSPEALDSPPDYTYVKALHAARQGNAEHIAAYLKFNPRYALCKNWEERMLLHDAAHYARAQVVQLLLKANPPINALYKDQTPLLLAIAGSPEAITDKTPEQFLDYRRRRRDTVKLLLNAGADMEKCTPLGENALHLAAKLGQSDTVEQLLQHGATADSPIVALDKQNPQANVGRTPLLLNAKYQKDKKTFKLLLDQGANPDTYDQDPGYAPIHYICSYHPAASDTQPLKEADLIDLLELLVAHKANLDACTSDKDKQPPLHLAIINHHLTLAELLLKYGADINVTNGKKFTVLGLCARNGDVKMVQYLLKKSADPEKARVLFHAAACKHSDEVLKFLLSLPKIDVNTPDRLGYTPIFSAISAYSLTNVKLLLDKGADLRMHSPKGLTVKEHAFACWGEVENVSDDDVSDERKQNADNARDIIQLLGGFD